VEGLRDAEMAVGLEGGTMIGHPPNDAVDARLDWPKSETILPASKVRPRTMKF
jgi:hypothetical protein